MRILFTFFWVGIISSFSFAGTLDAYEERIKEKPPSSSSSDSNSYSASTIVHSADEGSGHMLESLLAGIISSLFRSDHDNEEGNATEEDEGFNDVGGAYSHDLGNLTLPYVRVDYNWQYIDSNLYAQDVHIEAGYKAIGFLGRYTQYSQSDPKDEMTIDQYYLMLRYGTSDPDIGLEGLEIALGMGVATLKGNADESNFALTLPIKYYPQKWLGFEFRPAWYSFYEKFISDYDISTSVGSQFFHLRAGYRWQWVEHDGPKLKGPYLGVSISF